MTETTDTQQKITEITEAMRDLLLYKNQKYGDSALNPKRIFYKGDATSSILIRHTLERSALTKIYAGSNPAGTNTNSDEW